jgi:hypothetical protein
MTKEDTTRFLKKLERGIGQASDAGQAHVANGCKVHWDKVTEFVSQRCWCEDFLLRSMCFHSILYVLYQEWVEPPVKWACQTSNHLVNSVSVVEKRCFETGAVSKRTKSIL